MFTKEMYLNYIFKVESKNNRCIILYNIQHLLEAKSIYMNIMINKILLE